MLMALLMLERLVGGRRARNMFQVAEGVILTLGKRLPSPSNS